MPKFFWGKTLCGLSLLTNNLVLSNQVFNSNSKIITIQKVLLDDVTKYDYWGKLLFVDKESRNKRSISFNKSQFDLPTNATNFKITNLTIAAKYTMMVERMNYLTISRDYSDIIASREFNNKELNYINFSLISQNETLDFAWEAWRHGPHWIDVGGNYEVQVWIDGFTGFSAQTIK